MIVHIWTDGSCWPNPGPGGWAAVLEAGSARKELSGSQHQSTNIRCELIAAIEALKALKGGPHEVIFHTDSEYVCRAIEGMKKPKANFDLIEEFSALKSRHTVKSHWIKGHAGNLNNERCDTLAMQARVRA